MERRSTISNPSERLEHLLCYFQKVACFFSETSNLLIQKGLLSDHQHFETERIREKLLSFANRLNQDCRLEKINFDLLVDIEILVQQIKVLFRALNSGDFLSSYNSLLDPQTEQRLFQLLNTIKDSGKKIVRETKFMFKDSTNIKDLDQIHRAVGEKEEELLPKVIERTWTYNKSSAFEFGIFLMEDTLIVGNQFRNADILSTTNFKLVRTLDLQNRMFGTASLTQRYLIIRVHAKQDILVFDRYSFQRIGLFNVFKNPFYMLQLSDSHLFMCQEYRLSIMNTSQQSLGQMITLVSPGIRYCFALKTSKENEVALGSERGARFCTYDLNTGSITLSEEKYLANFPVQGIEEFKQDFLFLAVFTKSSFIIINRVIQSVVKEVPNPFGNFMQFNLRRLPDFFLNGVEPELFVRAGIISDQKQILLIDYQTMKLYKVAESENQQSEMYYLQFYCHSDAKGRLACYCLQNGPQTRVKKILFKKELTTVLKSLFPIQTKTSSRVHKGDASRLLLDGYCTLKEVIKNMVKQEFGQLDVTKSELKKTQGKFKNYANLDIRKLFSIPEQNYEVTDEQLLQMHETLLEQGLLKVNRCMKLLSQSIDHAATHVQNQDRITAKREIGVKEQALALYYNKSDHSHFIEETTCFPSLRYSIFISENYILAPAADGNVSLLDKKLKSLGVLDIGRNVLVACEFFGSIAFIGSQRSLEVQVFDLPLQQKVGSIYIQGFGWYNLKVSPIQYLSCEFSFLEIINMKTLLIDAQLYRANTRFLNASLTSRSNEVLIGSDFGIFFAVVDCDNNKIVFTQERYLERQLIQGAIEFKKHNVCAAIRYHQYLAIINRKLKQVSCKIVNPNTNFLSLNLVRLAGQSLTSPSFLLLRSQAELSLVDLVNFRIHSFIKVRTRIDVFYFTYVQTEMEDGCVTIYTNNEEQEYLLKKLRLKQDFGQVLTELKRL